jgi:hypothetical protein
MEALELAVSADRRARLPDRNPDQVRKPRAWTITRLNRRHLATGGDDYAEAKRRWRAAEEALAFARPREQLLDGIGRLPTQPARRSPREILDGLNGIGRLPTQPARRSPREILDGLNGTPTSERLP